MGKKSKAIMLLGIFTFIPLLFSCSSFSDDDDEPDNTTTCIKPGRDSTSVDSSKSQVQTKSNQPNKY
jgi:hypothetical protein